MVLKAGVDNLLKEDVEPENKCVQETTIEIERLSTADSLTVCCPWLQLFGKVYNSSHSSPEYEIYYRCQLRCEQGSRNIEPLPLLSESDISY